MTLDEETLDALLKGAPLRPSEGFAERVMQRVQSENDDAAGSASYFFPGQSRSTRRLHILRWLLVTLGGVVGIAQSGLFVFGLWFATAAG